MLWLQDLEEGEEDDEKTSTGKDSSDDTEKSDKEEDSTRVGSPKVMIAKIKLQQRLQGSPSEECIMNSVLCLYICLVKKKHSLVVVLNEIIIYFPK